MKSSSKFVPAEIVSSTSAWSPHSLKPEDNTADQLARAEEILAIFNGQISGQDHQIPHVKDSYIPSAVAPAYDAWAPEEINWTPAFLTETWSDWTNLVENKPIVSEQSKPEPQPVKPSPEEESAAILADARKQAEEIILEAQKNADEIIQQAQDEIRQAKEDGYQQSWDKAQADSITTLQAAHEIVTELTHWRDEMIANSENSMLGMLRDIARFMFGDGVKLDEMGIQMNLSRILENAKSLGNVRIFLNPGDAIRLDPGWKEYQSMLSGNKVVIVPSENIKPGGCFVQGDTGSIDARVEAQLDAVLGVLNPNSEVD